MLWEKSRKRYRSLHLKSARKTALMPFSILQASLSITLSSSDPGMSGLQRDTLLRTKHSPSSGLHQLICTFPWVTLCLPCTLQSSSLTSRDCLSAHQKALSFLGCNDWAFAIWEVHNKGWIQKYSFLRKEILCGHMTPQMTFVCFLLQAK